MYKKFSIRLKFFKRSDEKFFSRIDPGSEANRDPLSFLMFLSFQQFFYFIQLHQRLNRGKRIDIGIQYILLDPL